ncbi:MAG: flagellar biosynthetic protein FliR [Polyangiaceae bacterium]|jgi:flagellar biosynthesis protein FliR|nr:flagellar biosynthetic protein FliR [Polyangiaceae bacterium]
MSAPPELSAAIVDFFHTEGVDLGRLGLAWARVAPAVALVPSFGLRGAPGSFRVAAGLLLAASIAPALGPAPAGPWAGSMARALLAGVPLAVGAALPVWIAVTAGGVVDALRGAQEGVTLPVLEGRQGALGALWGLLACLGFLASGGPARVALAALEPATADGVARAVAGLTAGVGVAVAIAAPMLGAAALVEVALALVTRAATPASLAAVLGLGRGAALLGLSALFFERMAGLVLALSGLSASPTHTSPGAGAEVDDNAPRWTCGQAQ